MQKKQQKKKKNNKKTKKNEKEKTQARLKMLCVYKLNTWYICIMSFWLEIIYNG